jgi:hypothetical protein
VFFKLLLIGALLFSAGFGMAIRTTLVVRLTMLEEDAS